MKIKIQFAESSYRLVCGEEEGDFVDYGEPAYLDVSDRTYVALADKADNGDLEDVLGNGASPWVRELTCPSTLVVEEEDVEIEEEEAATVEAGAETDEGKGGEDAS